MRNIKKILIVTTVVILSIFTAACSYRVDFIVVNESDDEIEIRYSMPFGPYISPDQPTELREEIFPYLVSMETWKKDPKDEDWRKLTGTDVQADLKKEVITVIIPPRSALRLVRENDGIYFGDGYKNFKLKKLEISGRHGKIGYEGDQLLKHFSEKNYTTRIITYRAYQ